MGIPSTAMERATGQGKGGVDLYQLSCCKQLQERRFRDLAKNTSDLPSCRFAVPRVSRLATLGT